MRTKVFLAVASILVLVGVTLGSYHAGYYAATIRTATAAMASAETSPALDSSTSTDPAQQFEPFWEAWRLIEREFYNKAAIDYQKMTYGAIRGMLETLGDQHTTFETPRHAQFSAEDMRGSFDGIGVTVSLEEKRLTIVAPLDNSPGARAGLRAGDVIASIDDRSTLDMALSEAVSLIRGQRGTVVRLGIEREGEPELLVFEIERAEIKMSLVRGRMIDDVGYVKITQFSEPTTGLVQQKLKELMAERPKGIVVDLRNNPGGLLTSAVDVASQFIDDGVVLHEQQREGDGRTYRARRGGVATDIPLVVLVNKGSASASEIVAGALQDRGRAVLVGERSFGKDTVQNVHVLSDKSSVRVTVAKWFTPNKQSIAGKGLQPDVEVAITEEDVRAGRDPQLDLALQTIRGAGKLGGS